MRRELLSRQVLCARLAGCGRSDGTGRWLGGRQGDWGIQYVQLRNRGQKGSPSIPDAEDKNRSLGFSPCHYP